MEVTNIVGRTVETYKDLTFVGSNATVSMTTFTLTGAVLVHQLWLEVTTNIGVNHTAGYFNSYDGAAAIDITLNGITLSGLKAGTIAFREDVKTAALTLENNANDIVDDVAAKNTQMFTPFIWVGKTAATNTMRYTYTTTDTPTSGVIRVHAVWEPLTMDGLIAGDGVLVPDSVTGKRWQ